MSRVLVTGASGFIGRQLLAPLCAEGHEVHAVCRHRRSEAGTSSDVAWHELDLLDGQTSAQLVAQLRPECLLHLAWYAEHGLFWSSPENVRWVEASLALLRAFAAADGRRAVLAGTCAEYDWEALALGVCSEERTPLEPRTLYGTCKRATHMVAQSFAEQTGVSFAWGRVFFLYGPHEQPARLVPAIARSLLAGARMPTSDGRQLRDFMHVRDVARAFVELLRSDVRGAVNIASGQPVEVASVVDLISAATGRGDLLERGVLERPAGDPDVLVADATRLREEVGFTPSVELEEGLAATVDWWREHPDG